MSKKPDIWDSVEHHKIKGRHLDAPDIFIRKNSGWGVPDPDGSRYKFFYDKDHHGLPAVSLLAASNYARVSLNRDDGLNIYEHILNTPFPRYCAYFISDQGGDRLYVEFIFESRINEDGVEENYVFREDLGYPHKIKSSKFKSICEKYYRYWLWYSSIEGEHGVKDIYHGDYEIRSRQFKSSLAQFNDQLPTLSELFNLVGYSYLKDEIEKPIGRYFSK